MSPECQDSLGLDTSPSTASLKKETEQRGSREWAVRSSGTLDLSCPYLSMFLSPGHEDLPSSSRAAPLPITSSRELLRKKAVPFWDVDMGLGGG